VRNEIVFETYQRCAFGGVVFFSLSDLCKVLGKLHICVKDGTARGIICQAKLLIL
jgi:hypothetical protein